MAQQTNSEIVRMILTRVFESKKTALKSSLTGPAERYLHPWENKLKFELVIQMCQESIAMLEVYKPTADDPFPLHGQLEEEVKGGKENTLANYLRLFVFAYRKEVREFIADPLFSAEEKNELVSVWTGAFEAGKKFLAEACESQAHQAADYKADPDAFIAARRTKVVAITAHIMDRCNLHLSKWVPPKPC